MNSHVLMLQVLLEEHCMISKDKHGMQIVVEVDWRRARSLSHTHTHTHRSNTNGSLTNIINFMMVQIYMNKNGTCQKYKNKKIKFLKE